MALQARASPCRSPRPTAAPCCHRPEPEARRVPSGLNATEPHPTGARSPWTPYHATVGLNATELTGWLQHRLTLQYRLYKAASASTTDGRSGLAMSLGSASSASRIPFVAFPRCGLLLRLLREEQGLRSSSALSRCSSASRPAASASIAFLLRRASSPFRPRLAGRQQCPFAFLPRLVAFRPRCCGRRPRSRPQGTESQNPMIAAATRVRRDSVELPPRARVRPAHVPARRAARPPDVLFRAFGYGLLALPFPFRPFDRPFRRLEELQLPAGMSPAARRGNSRKQVEVGRAPEHALGAAGVGPLLRRVREATVEPDLVAILVQPPPEFRPVFEQSFVRDLGDGPAVLVSRERDRAADQDRQRSRAPGAHRLRTAPRRSSRRSTPGGECPWCLRRAWSWPGKRAWRRPSDRR